MVVTRVGKDGCRYGPQGKEQMLCQNSDALMWNLISGHHQLILCVLQHYARTCIHSRTYSFTRDHTFTRACNGPIRFHSCCAILVLHWGQTCRSVRIHVSEYSDAPDFKRGNANLPAANPRSKICNMLKKLFFPDKIFQPEPPR